MLWLAVFFSGVLTYAQRLSLIVLWQRIRPSLLLQRALRFVPIAVLSALIVPDLFLIEGEFHLALDNGRLIAGALAVLVAWRTRSVLLTILAGMAALLLHTALFT